LWRNIEFFIITILSPLAIVTVVAEAAGVADEYCITDVIAIVIDIESNVIAIQKVLTLGMQPPMIVFKVDMAFIVLSLIFPLKSRLTMLMY
jgi:hypothetical protein